MAIKLLSINFCPLFLTALLFMASCMNSTKASDEFIKASCKTTPYPALCYTSLSKYASSIKTSQRLLAKTAIKITLDVARNTSSFLVKLSGNEKTRKSKTGPVGDCVELLRNVVDEVSKSVKEMDRIKDHRDIRFRISNVQTWVSAAMTDENTCTEGMTGKTVSAKVKRMVTEKMEVIPKLELCASDCAIKLIDEQILKTFIAELGVDGLRFIARDISFRNTAGPENGQAVALRSGSDLSVFYKCAFYGYQDTLFVHSQRQFYKMCYIFGTIDIIFGNAAAVFQNCMIYVRKPIWGQANVITAQGRADPNQNTGIVIHSSRIMADKDLVPMGRSVVTYLGRPWQEYSRTIIMKTYIGPLVDSAGWMPWNGDRFLNTLYYAEYANFGPGSEVRRRVNWPGFHVIKSPNVATLYTVGHFIAGRTWLPTTGIPFSLGL